MAVRKLIRNVQFINHLDVLKKGGRERADAEKAEQITTLLLRLREKCADVS